MGFYETLEHVMLVKGITPAELSRAIGVRQSYFTELKKGRAKDVTWTRAKQIIAALDMTVSEFAALENALNERHGE